MFSVNLWWQEMLIHPCGMFCRSHQGLIITLFNMLLKSFALKHFVYYKMKMCFFKPQILSCFTIFRSETLTSVEFEPYSPSCHLVESPCKQTRWNIVYLITSITCVSLYLWNNWATNKQPYLDMHTSRTCCGVKAKMKYFSWWYLCVGLAPENINDDCYLQSTDFK